MRWMAIPLVVLVGCAATARDRDRAAEVQVRRDQGLAKELAGLVPHGTSDCLPVVGPRSLPSKGYGAKIVYRASSRSKYVTDVGPGCESYGDRDGILITRNPIGRSCRGDIIQVLDRASRFPVGSCAFGSFTEYRRP